MTTRTPRWTRMRREEPPTFRLDVLDQAVEDAFKTKATIIVGDEAAKLAWGPDAKGGIYKYGR